MKWRNKWKHNHEEELDNIHPDVDNNFPSPTMNSGLMTVHNIYPENFIDEQEYFSGIAANSWVGTKETPKKKLSPNSSLHNRMEYHTPTCSPTSLY